jgi:DNA segregation ATPase FtsK/SpoIIIE, S-DNA-T family
MPPARKTAPRNKRKSTRARRSSAGWSGLPVIEQRHLDLAGLAFVAVGVFLAFPLYLHWDGGRAGEGVVHALQTLVGEVAYAAPITFVLIGAVLVLRPVLPAVRPFRAGGICLFLACTLALSAGTLGAGPGHARANVWDAWFVRPRGGLAGEALYSLSASLFGPAGAHILAVFLFLAGVLLVTGASIAGVLRATSTSVLDTTRALRRTSEELGQRLARPEPEPVSTAARRKRTIAPPEPEDSEPLVSRASAAAQVEDPPAPDEAATLDDRPSLDGAVRYPDLFGDDTAAPSAFRRPPAEPGEPLQRDEPEPDAGALAEPAEPAEPELVDDPTSGEPSGFDAPPPRPARDAVAEQAELPLARGDDGEIEWRVPDRHLLKRSTGEAARPDTAGQEKTAARLIEALQHFNVPAQMIGTVAGPHITRYEFRLAPGIKMSKVAQMKDDLAYALAATDIRILAPIPGKQAVGVEVPNARRKIVQLGDVFQDAPKEWSPLTVWLGKDVSGKAIGADLAKMPHLLVAGTTGAGKSGCINAMLSSILLNAKPDEVKLVLVDPKQVELNHYDSIPHLLTPVITSPRSAANALQNLVREMEWRYGIMSMAKTRSLPELNRYRIQNEEDALPYILCVIDELADLMMVAPADVEDSIIRLAQKARAVGIHLVLATQSPRVDVITGMIKANVPSRIAFAVSSQTDSRVILDQNGAETLLGQGDMLFSPVGSSRLQRIQGAYIDEPQIAAITDWWNRQGEPELREDLLEEVEPEQADAGGGDDDGFDPDEDPLLGDAIQLVVEMGTASTSMLQRRLRLGYTRAGRLIDMLERRGIISGYEGSKPRQVLVAEGDLPRVLAALQERGSSLPTVPEPEPEPVAGGDGE